MLMETWSDGAAVAGVCAWHKHNYFYTDMHIVFLQSFVIEKKKKKRKEKSWPSFYSNLIWKQFCKKMKTCVVAVSQQKSEWLMMIKVTTVKMKAGGNQIKEKQKKHWGWICITGKHKTLEENKNKLVW